MIWARKKKKRETRIWYVDLQYRIRVFCCKIEFYHSSFFQRLLHVDDALVAAAPEEEVFVAQCLYEGAVYQYIDLAEEFQLLGILHEVFEEIARKAPDALAALLPDGARQLGKALCLEHRVAAREGDVGEGVAHDFLHQLVGRGHRAVADVPRLRIMAARTMVGASRTINGCAEARTVYHRIMYDA